MSKRVEEFVKNAKVIDEKAKLEIEAMEKHREELEKLTSARAEQCQIFMKECTEEEFNELLLIVNNDDKLMYLAMRKVTDIFKDIKDIID